MLPVEQKNLLQPLQYHREQKLLVYNHHLAATDHQTQDLSLR